MRILIIEDEPRMRELLSRGLYESGFTVMTAADGETGLRMAQQHELDAIVLDIGLPRMDGFALTEKLRAGDTPTPILMLTARDNEDSIIRGLDLGADDYLTKPFSFPELVARLQCITRLQLHPEETIQAGNIRIDPKRRTAHHGSRSMDLTRQEFQLLSCLVHQAGQCVSRQDLKEQLWGNNHPVSQNALEVLVNGLRAKVESDPHKKSIHTVRGRGYMLKTEEAMTRRSA